MDELDLAALRALVVALLAKQGHVAASDVQDMARAITPAAVHPRIAAIVSDAYRAADKAGG